MNMRPRCREWLPLTTQQLRLRNLVRIQGINIENSDENLEQRDIEAGVYYTLHSSKDDEAFYRSEILPRRRAQLKWAEIVCNQMLKSNANCVCIKVWLHLERVGVVLKTDKDNVSKQQNQQQQQPPQLKEPISALTKALSNINLLPNKLPRPPDKLLFIWGVYFSGLIPINQLAETKFKPNCLIFQLNGDYFASPHYILAESLREQLSLSEARYSVSTPKMNNPRLTSQASEALPISRSAIPQQYTETTAPSVIDESPNNNFLLDVAKTRYMQLFCPRSEVRSSYSLETMLRIQALQRKQLKVEQETADIAKEIKRLSVSCITPAELSRKPRTTSLSSSSSMHHQNHSMGRTLSVLLAEQQQIEPRKLLQAQHIMKQVELVRARTRILQAERGNFCNRLHQKHEQHRELKTMCQERAKWLATQQLELNAAINQLNESMENQVAQAQLKRRIEYNIERRISTLMLELGEIYPIGRNERGLFTICDVPLPNMEEYVCDAKYAQGLEGLVTPNALSAALGYIAHLVQMIAVIINRPLRNPIRYEGSRSKVMDMIKNIPNSMREFPLYTRSIIPSKILKYAIFLLNQNVAQLCYDITGARCDTRATIENLSYIFATLRKIDENQRELDAIDSRNQQQQEQQHDNNGSNSGDNVVCMQQPKNRLTFMHTACNIDTTNGKNISLTGSKVSGNGSGGSGSGSGGSGQSVDCLSKSHSSIDMNHVPPVPLTPPMLLSHATTVGDGSHHHYHHHHNHRHHQTSSSSSSSLLLCRMLGSKPIGIDNSSHHHHHHHSTGNGSEHHRGTSAVDGDAGVGCIPQQRISRSVGSYSDFEDNYTNIVEHVYSNSDSNIPTFQTGNI